MNKKNLFFLSLILFFSCSNKDGEGMKYTYSKPSIEIELDTTELIHFNILEKSITNIFENIDSIRTIPLETTDEALIGQVSMICIVNDTLFVADYHKAKSIFVFDLQGRYLHKIHHTGEGPGEYKNINMVQIDSNGITILDWLSWKLIKYDLSGKLLFEKRIDPNPHDFIEMDNNEMIFGYNTYSAKTPFRIVFTDTALQWKETAMPQLNDRIKGSSGGISVFQKIINGDILYNMWLNDTVYHISPDKRIIPKYHLGFHAPGEIASFFEKTKDFNDKDFFRYMTNLIWSFVFFELDDMYFVSYTKNDIGKSYVSIIQKKDFKISHSIVSDNKNRFVEIPVSIAGHHQNSVLGWIDDNIIDMLTKKNIDYFFAHLEDKEIRDIKALKGTDKNPTIVFIYFNKYE